MRASWGAPPALDAAAIIAQLKQGSEAGGLLRRLRQSHLLLALSVEPFEIAGRPLSPLPIPPPPPVTAITGYVLDMEYVTLADR